MKSELLNTEERAKKYKQLYEMYCLDLFHIAMLVLHDKQKAEDAVQDAFLKIVKILDSIADVSSKKTKGLLIIIVKNTAKDYLKAKNTTSTISMEDLGNEIENSEPSLLEQIISSDGYKKLIGYMNKLDDTTKAACQLKFIYGYDEKSIASLLDLTPKAVNMRIYRGRQKLKVMIKEEAEKDEQKAAR